MAVPTTVTVRHAHLAGIETVPSQGGRDPACQLPAPHECRNDQDRPLTFIDGELSFASWCHAWAQRTGRAS